MEGADHVGVKGFATIDSVSVSCGTAAAPAPPHRARAAACGAGSAGIRAVAVQRASGRAPTRAPTPSPSSRSPSSMWRAPAWWACPVPPPPSSGVWPAAARRWQRHAPACWRIHPVLPRAPRCCPAGMLAQGMALLRGGDSAWPFPMRLLLRPPVGLRSSHANACAMPPPAHRRSVMRDQNVNVIMISQASSEHSVCFAVKTADTEKALAALNKRWVGAPPRLFALRPDAACCPSRWPPRPCPTLTPPCHAPPAVCPEFVRARRPRALTVAYPWPAGLWMPSARGASPLWRRCATAVCWRRWASRWPGGRPHGQRVLTRMHCTHALRAWWSACRAAVQLSMASSAVRGGWE